MSRGIGTDPIGVQESHPPDTSARRKPQAMPYVKPELYRHGDIRSLTLGSPIGMGESGGMSLTQQAV